jgi:two-component system nitrogen regulation sensor histidine kinase GlnL
MFEKEILESILEPITVIDYSGKILYSNQEFEKLSVYSWQKAK